MLLSVWINQRQESATLDTNDPENDYYLVLVFICLIGEENPSPTIVLKHLPFFINLINILIYLFIISEYK